MNIDQPNLQDILLDVTSHYAVPSITAEDGMKEAIDAIYAGLLAEVIGEDYPYMQSEGNTSSYDFIPMAKNALKVEQRESLKRWCYGENASNDTQGAE